MKLNLSLFDNKEVCVTGGTGSFGKAFIKYLTEFSKVSRITVLSRDEIKQWEMGLEYSGDSRLNFIIGDVRDLESVRRAVRGCNYVIHAAATKIVPIAEHNPRECIRTNVDGALNVIEGAYLEGVEKVVALSTDKASSPANLYGASKLVSDKLFVAADTSGSYGHCSFSVVRYGNVMGSRGSVIPFFLEKAKTGLIPITDPTMSRFMITMDQAIEVVIKALTEGVGGEIFVRKIPSMTVASLARALAPDAEHKIIGKRAGEKVHEQMIGVEDSPNTLEFQDYFVILPTAEKDYRYDNYIKFGGSPVPIDFTYVSDRNDETMTGEDLIRLCRSYGWL